MSRAPGSQNGCIYYQVIILIIISPNPPHKRRPFAGAVACFCIFGSKTLFPPHTPELEMYIFIH